MFPCRRAAVLAVGLFLGARPVLGQIPLLDTAPSFFGVYLDRYSRVENLALMRQDSVSLDPHGVVSILGFQWGRAPGSRVSWKMDMEELICLLPFIASQSREDRDFAREWFGRWDDTHLGGTADPVAWDPMTVAIRSMVLVFFLQCEEETYMEGSVAPRLREAILRHQQFLVRPGRWDADSNHGMWEAMGLIETCRAVPDAAALDVGLARLADIVTGSTSSAGGHLEHSPHYHFAVLKWLDEVIRYMELLPGFSWDGMAGLDDARARMTGYGYYLQDHSGRMIPVGDTSEALVSPLVPRGEPAGSLLFDPQAGYAVFKEAPESLWKRMVVLNIQPSERPFPHHFHDDALAVVISFDGETLFGDQGAYDYGQSQYRRFVKSAGAHNLVAPGTYVAALGSPRDSSNHVTGAAMHVNASVRLSAARTYDDGAVSRRVVIAMDTPDLVIDDEITGREMLMLWNVGVDVKEISAVPVTVDDLPVFARVVLKTRGSHEFVVSLSYVSGTGDGVTLAILRGAFRPMLGWRSRSYGKIERSRVIAVQIDAPTTRTIRTAIARVR